MESTARFGLAARAFVYLVIGWLAIQIALGHRSQQANQKGALAEISGHSYGTVLLWILGFGFAAYALWRLSEAAFGVAGEGRKVGPRVQSLVRGIIYAALSVTTFAFIAGGSRQGQAQQQQTATAKLMKHGYGRWLVGLVGIIVVAVGVLMIVEGVTKKFERQLRMNELHGAVRTLVVRLGVIGTIARGIVFAIAGALVVDAAITYDPAKSTGLDGALRTLANQPYGPWLLGLLALGLIVFGVYGFAAARWAKT
jgi:vacuolar-type H+-ATPase subunit I/STV1